MRDKGKLKLIGVDLGGTKILSAVITTKGEILSRDYRPTQAEKGVETVIQRILASVEEAAKKASLDIGEIDALGIGAAGISNPETGIVYASPNLPAWRNVPVRGIIEKESGKKTYLINDAKAGALGEFYFGAARGAKNFIYVTIGTGIGGGIFVDGELYFGAIGSAGEIGHMTIDVNGPHCSCGNVGCWEVMASGTALARRAVERIKQGASTTIMKYAGGSPEKVSAEAVQRAAEAGDPVANELIAETACYFGVGLTNLINIFNPELILIGGGLANIGGKLLEPAFEIASQRVYKETLQVVRFARTALGNDSGVIGAAMFAYHTMKRQAHS